MLKLIIAFSIGTVFGVAVMCCCAVAGRADRNMGESFKDETDIS
ncbi:MAG: DUF3789 domain-containing protein [Clostridia bacterium]|nr:DUF3789 domain-containing protein [Clostridia bacterium]